MRVMVVDDNRDGADTTVTLLELAGHQAIAVYDGRAALSAFITFAPDAALVNIGLPATNGCKLARQLREADDRMLLIAVSGCQSVPWREMGINHFLLKPFDFDELRALLWTDQAMQSQQPPQVRFVDCPGHD